MAACMSGNFVQRGDFALLEKHARAEAALSGGADLVLELPTPWACAPAERFAQGGVAVLEAVPSGTSSRQDSPARTRSRMAEAEEKSPSSPLSWAAPTLGRASGSMALPLRQMGKEDFRPYDGGNEGLYRRFYQAVQSETALEDVLAAAKTKRYPLARLRRVRLDRNCRPAPLHPCARRQQAETQR